MRLGRAPAAIAAAAWLLSLPALADGDGAAAQTVWPTKGWAVSTPEAQGLDSGALARLVESVGKYPQDSLLVVRHGRIVLEAYYAPYEAGIPHDLRSVTKSVVGTLTGITVEQGLLAGTGEKVAELFADRKIAHLDARKQAITVQNLLDMSSGIEWVEKNYTPDETIIRMYGARDRTSFVLDQPMSDAPGTRFQYNGGNPYLLSALVTKKTGKSAFDFAQGALFRPLGITSADWGKTDKQGVTNGEAGLFLTPRDMARLGYLYLEGGVWEGKRLIPADWVAAARAGKVEATYGFHYGELWWSLPEKDAYMARGRHSQLILVLPKLDMIAVMTGVLRDDEYYSPSRLIDEIAASVKSDGPLPEDKVARSLLDAALRQTRRERPSPVGRTSPLAKAISGKVYRFAENRLHVKSVALTLTGPSPRWTIVTDGSGGDEGHTRFSGLIGLDGSYRKSPRAWYGIDAAKGTWQDARRFVLERRILGHGETQRWTLAFDGKKLDVRLETTDGFKAELRGEAKE